MTTTETATIGGGCFWCTEAIYDDVIGVSDVVSGYSGGRTPNPTYEAVCSGSTGHAEVIQVTFDPQVLSYRDLLDVFLATHDPTTLNRQGADAGTQYRSVIFYHTPEQEQVAREVIAASQPNYRSPIVTEIAPIERFYPAEEYHQEYFLNNPNQPYCRAVVAPKVQKFRKSYAAKLKA
ncbi:MAG: peptide-methionine (S)-S-oxide reductase MsrA [Roseiflexaceae bacterium]|nr:peptide-methionine (S)-S-oxide reductase MsrA [Roseiflexaceae bacterium]